MKPLVSIVIPVRNGEKYIKHCLVGALNQSYQPIEVVVFDNGSTDKTVEIIDKEFANVKIHRSPDNLFVGPALNQALRLNLCRGELVLLLCVDVILDSNFIEEAVKVMQQDGRIGVLQAKILRFDIGEKGEVSKTNVIDTTGFEIYRSRRVVNRGHGEEDCKQYDQDGKIFAYEGAAGFFRKTALEESAIDKNIFDEDFKWMVDDLDLGWRLTLLGWKNYYAHQAICYHDRKTTKRLSHSRWDFIRQRRNIPPLKRRLDYRNMHLTFIKNEVVLLLAEDFWYIFWRELQLFIYILLFEWSTLPAVFELLVMLPQTLKKRREIMEKMKIKIDDLHQWFIK